MISYAPPARAIADAARQLADAADVRAVVAAGVQRGKVQIWQLAEELAKGPVRGSAGLRRALAEVAEGVRSTAEADLLRLIRRARLPVPLLNPRLYVGGKFLASPDAWWPDAGVAVEVDSRQWHLAPAQWEETMARHARMSSHGIIVLHYSPNRIRSEGNQVAAEIRAALAAGRSRSLPPVAAMPA
jgi:very-short-patch-repair endonuclease